MANELQGRMVAILIAPVGTEQVEFVQPKEAVEAEGATVEVIGLQAGEAKTMNNDTEPGETFMAEKAVADVSPDDYDALIVPGGTVGADNLRGDADAVAFVRGFFEQAKPVGVIIQEPNDAIVRITTTNICGSDLHLYEVLGPFIDAGDILGHEPMGIVEEVGPEVTHIAPGDRVVLPFNISCGHCFMCDQRLYSQCETTQVHEYGTGAKFFGYTKLYGQVPGGQAEFLRVPQAQFVPIKVPEEGASMPDERFVYLSDVLPTSWQAVEYAGIPDGGSVAVFGLGPIGQMSARIARHRGHRVIGVDLVPERLDMARRYDVEVVDLRDHDDIAETIREMTDGRGPDSVIDAVGMEAHGSGGGKMAQTLVGLLPDSAAQTAMEKGGVDRLTALNQCIETVRRGGTLSISGVYGGTADPLNLLQLFDKQIQVRMGQANVKAWVDDIMPLLVGGGDPLGVEDFATHKMPLDDAPHAYEIFQKKQDGAVKILLQP